MMNKETFDELVREIMSQGYDPETAGRYAALIGDTPCADEQGNILVLDNLKVIARLKPLKLFETD